MLDLANVKADKLETLRKNYPSFIYESFDYKFDKAALRIKFHFRIVKGVEFNPVVTVSNIPSDFLSNFNKPALENLIFHLGLAEIPTYWKSTCAKDIAIKAGFLSNDQIKWWRKLMLKGMSEFFYQNKINFTTPEFLNIKSSSTKKFFKDEKDHQDRFLILNGGGRDSVVTIETLKNLESQKAILMLNPTIAAINVAQTSAIENIIIVERTIDKKLIDLNTKQYLNGHTPFSAYLSFLSELICFVFDFKYAVVSNEKSSNEGNIQYLRKSINHQYSKSYEYERLFREYSKKYLSESIKYFSLVRPFFEIQISKIFSSYPKYFSSFRSCNKGQKTNAWCGNCSKCLSIYISLFPFMEEDSIKAIFGTNLYEKKELLDLLLHLVGKKSPKPFECVGTHEEIRAGLCLSIEKLEKDKKPLPYLLTYSKNKLLKNKTNTQKLLKNWDTKNFVPAEIINHLEKWILEN